MEMVHPFIFPSKTNILPYHPIRVGVFVQHMSPELEVAPNASFGSGSATPMALGGGSATPNGQNEGVRNHPHLA
jgi:hypothetical protein